MAKHIKCPKCGEFNTDREYCVNCGAVLSYRKRRKIAFEMAEKLRKEKERLNDKMNPSFFDKYSNHRFWLVRASVRILHSIWLGFLAIGSFIAWLITAIAA